MMKQECPLCKKDFEDIIKHFSVSHGLCSMEEVGEAMKKEKEKDKKREEFRKYIKELNLKLKNNEISGEQFRSLVNEWEEKWKIKK